MAAKYNFCHILASMVLEMQFMGSSISSYEPRTITPDPEVTRQHGHCAFDIVIYLFEVRDFDDVIKNAPIPEMAAIFSRWLPSLLLNVEFCQGFSNALRLLVYNSLQSWLLTD